MKQKKMLKKFIFSFALAVGLALGTAAVCSFADYYTDSQGVKYDYTVGETTASVVGHNADLTDDIIIPSKITVGTYNYNVTAIGDGVFQNCSILKKVTIQEGVTTIGNRAFDGCSSLTSVEIPSNVTTIGFYTFRNCSSLTSVEIPSIVTEIQYGTFSGCSSLTSVAIPSSVTTIGYGAFFECISLTSVTIPPSITSIGQGVLDGCTSLADVYVKNGLNLNLSRLGINDDANVWRYELLPEAEQTVPGKILVNITSKDQGNGNTITCGAMGEKYVIRSVYSGVNFSHSCTNLVNGTFDYTDSNNIIWTCTIKLAAVGNTPGKVSIVPKNKNSINGAVTIPSTATNGCFDYTVTTIGDSAFEECSSLTSITIPQGVTTIGGGAFGSCRNLTSVTFEDTQENPSQLTIIGSWAFYRCSSLTSITIPQSVTTIGDWAFRDCDSLTGVTIPEGVTTIGEYAFLDCERLGSITISESVTTIGMSAFMSCTGLRSVTIPSSVTTIGYYVFQNCGSLTDVYVENGLDVSSANINSTANVWRYVVLSDQSGAPEGKTLVKITSKDQGNSDTVTCDAMGENYVIRSAEGSGATLTHSCISSPFNVTENGVAWTCTILEMATESTAGKVSIKPSESVSGNITIPSNVLVETNTCGTFSFAVTEISYHAFSNCTNLTGITIPEGVTEIKNDAFSDCTNLTVVIIPNTVTTINENAFLHTGLTSVTIPESVRLIGKAAFAVCKELESVTILNGVTTIGEQAFGYCSKLKSITIPVSVETIGNSCFVECSRLENFYLKNGMSGETLGNYTANLWYYEVLLDQSEAPIGKTLVKIVRKVRGNGTSVKCDAMGENYVIDKVEVNNVKLEHTLYYEDEVEPTTTEYGHIAGYTCSYCGKHFRDEEGTEEIPNDEWIIYSSGDINGDGFDNILDLQMLYNHVAGVSILTEEQLGRADLNNNGTVDIIDLQILFNIIAAA